MLAKTTFHAKKLFAGNLVLDPLQPDSTNEVSRPISKCIRTLTCKYHLSSQVYACNNSVHTTCECYVRSFRVTIYLQPTIQPIWTIINNPWTNNEGSCRTQVTMIGHFSKDIWLGYKRRQFLMPYEMRHTTLQMWDDLGSQSVSSLFISHHN